MGERILLADDSFTIQKVVYLALADEAYEIRSVSSGEIVMDTIREFRPNLILLDINLSGKSGYEICEMLNSSPFYSDIPIVLLRGTFEPYDPERLKNLKYTEIITKPFDSAVFATKIREILEKQKEKIAYPSSIPEELPEEIGEELIPTPIAEAEEEALFKEEPVKPEEMEQKEEPIFAGKTWESIAQETLLGEESEENPFLEEEVMEAVKPEVGSPDEIVLEIISEPSAEIPLEIESAPEIKKEEIYEPSFKPEETPIYLSEESIEKIAKKVVAMLSPEIIKEVAWEVIPDLAEIIIKEEIEKIKKEIVPS